MQVWSGTIEGSAITVERRVQVVYNPKIEIDGHKFLLSKVVEVVDGLVGTDGYSSAINIFDGRLGETLEQLGVAVRTSRGVYRQGPNCESFLEKVARVNDAAKEKVEDVKLQWQTEDVQALER